MQQDNLKVIRAYLRDLAAGVTGDDLAAYFTDDAMQIEFPNGLNPNGGESNLATLLTRAEQGRHMLKQQSYEITSELVQDDRVAIEAIWTGTLAMTIGSLGADTKMTAHFAMFFAMDGGKIRVQRNYDCFLPW